MRAATLTSLLTMWLAACFGPAIEPGVVECGAQGFCPTGFICSSSNRCVKLGTQEEEPDAGVDPSCSGCDPLASCDISETTATCVCPAGYSDDNGDGSVCSDVDECATGADDCSSEATCTNNDGGFDCACNLGFEGDGVSCTAICSRVLVFDDCNDGDGDCSTINETQFADDAASVLGYDSAYFGPSATTQFVNEFDDNNFDVLVIESSLENMPAQVKSRTIDWINNGGKLIFSYWNLDDDNELRDALGVNVVASFNTPMPVVTDPDADPNIFNAIEELPETLTFTDPMIDDGDELDIADGDILARFNDAAGSAAIVRTNQGSTITLGFLPIGMVFQGPADDDNDNKNDVTELYTNLIAALCGRIPPATP